MWQEITDNKYLCRSMKERLHYENDKPIKYDEYTQTIVDDKEIYDEDLRQDNGIRIDYYEIWE